MLPFFMLLPYVVVEFMQEWRLSCKRILLTVLGVCFCFTSINAAGMMHELGNHKGINITKQKEMTDFLVHNGYQYGFSTYWYANSTVQLSDGQLDVCALDSLEAFEKMKWLSTEEQINYIWQDKTFLLSQMHCSKRAKKCLGIRKKKISGLMAAFVCLSMLLWKN